MPRGARGFTNEGLREGERAGGDVCRGEFCPSMAVRLPHSAGGVREAEGKTAMDCDHPGSERAAGAARRSVPILAGRVPKFIAGSGASIGGPSAFLKKTRSIGLNRVNGAA